MSNKKNNRNRKSLEEIEKERGGGAHNIGGISYQCLYSCYILLKNLDSNNKKIRLEGVEDIDSYIVEENGEIEHIQLKLSSVKKSADFFGSILKNYLEVYLSDRENPNRYFKLVYDSKISDGNLKKLIGGECDNSSTIYWQDKIDKIREKTPEWEWEGFDYFNFIGKLRFQNISESEVVDIAYSLLIKRYNIDSGNEKLYYNSLFQFCFQKMKKREYITFPELESHIADVREDIAKGPENPAWKWINLVDFSNLKKADEEEYYNGKKAEPSDIVAELPIRRLEAEREIEQSISENIITVIKSSSGQGKTTLAWQVAYNLSKDYKIYSLTWCEDKREVGNIVADIHSRIKAGELLLIVIDNLSGAVREWNHLAERLQSEIGTNYRIVITTREDDWYRYSSDQSSLRKLKVRDISLNERQAKEIYKRLKERGKIDSKIDNWQDAWRQVEGQQLLIEYIYLLTHGEMLSTRIEAQIKTIEKSPNSTIQKHLLRVISFANTINIGLSVGKTASYFSNKYENSDIDYIFKSLEREFFIKQEENSISGLHPVRSEHVLKHIHTSIPKSSTLIEMLDLIESTSISLLYSHFPSKICDEERDSFYQEVAKKVIDSGNSYHQLISGLEGLLYADVSEYYINNKSYFDDANEHGGLELFAIEISPYTEFKEFDIELKTLKKLSEDEFSENATYLHELSREIEKFELKKSNLYIYGYYLSDGLRIKKLMRIKDGFSSLVYWLIKIDSDFNILDNSIMIDVWSKREDWELDSIAELMLSYFLTDRKSFMEYYEQNKEEILHYLKVKTNSLMLYEDPSDKSINVRYILLPNDVAKANDESVSRLNLIFKTLPIYEYYNAKAIKPNIDILNDIGAPNDDLKNMPIRNLAIAIHSKFVNLWTETILSKYEAASVEAWLSHYLSLRWKIVELYKKNIKLLRKIMEKKNEHTQEFLKDFVKLRVDIYSLTTMEYPFPSEHRPFEENRSGIDNEVKKSISSMGSGYFLKISTYINQMDNLISKNQDNAHLAIINLRTARINIIKMQETFENIAKRVGHYSEEYANLVADERRWSEELLFYVYYYYYEYKIERSFHLEIFNEWKNSVEQKYIEKIKNAIEENSGEFFFQYPDKIMDDGFLYTITLITEELESPSEKDIYNLLSLLTPLADFDIHFVLVIFKKRDTNIAKSYGVRFSKDYLAEIRNFINGNNDEISKYSPLYHITDEYLKCFDESLKMEQEPPSDAFSNLSLKLWELSKILTYLNIPIDREYLLKKQKGIKSEIKELLEIVRENPPPLYGWLEPYIDDLFNGKPTFGDEELNKLSNELIKISAENQNS